MATTATTTAASTAVVPAPVIIDNVRERAASTPIDATAVRRNFTPPPAAFREPTAREIQERAYFIYLARGGVSGDPAADWLRAERELREEFRTSARTV